MEEVIRQVVNGITNSRNMFIICMLFIACDTISGYIKAFALKNYSSTISRKGLASKMTWILMLIMGLIVEYIIKMNMLIMVIGVCCVTTEFMSIVENAHELGIDFKITEYIEKSDKDGTAK